MDKLRQQLGIFIFLLTCAFTVPVLVQQGMFMDGVLYAAVSKNLAEGYGTFFAPRFSEIGVASSSIFYEHPPLAFGIQSLFFKLFNSHFLSERIYSWFTLVVTFFLFKELWKEISNHISGIGKMDWLPILIWITIPLVYWGYQNNAQENTMGIFTLCGTIFTIKYLFRQEQKIKWLVLAGISAFLASYSKGVPGLFILGIIPIHFLVFRTLIFKKYLISFLLLLGTTALCYLLLITYEPAREHLLNYLNLRLLGRINDSHTVHSHFVIIYRIFWELIYGLLVTLVLLGVFSERLKKHNWLADQKKWILFFFLIGLSGSAPVALTMVQKGFYILPSFPFFAISIALILAYGFQDKLLSIKNPIKISKIIFRVNIVFLLFLSFLTTSLYKDYSRSESLLKSVDTIISHVPERTTVTIQSNLWNDWYLQSYLMRYGSISVERTKKHEFVIVTDSIPAGYLLLEKLGTYNLYSKNNN